ncbi:ComF family protein [Limnobacter humi]|nr:ComF family protein [Limnobacter humi]
MPATKHRLYRFWLSARHAFEQADPWLPWRVCTACEQPFRRHATAGHALCAWLCTSCTKHVAIAQRTVRCVQCALPLGPRPQAFGWTRCRHCKANPDPDLQALVCSDYSPPADDWIQTMKYRKGWGMVPMLADWLADQWRQDHRFAQNRDWTSCTLLPVPSSPGRLRQRGYNQAALLAKALGQRLNWRLNTDTLHKTEDTQSQAGLDKAGRLQNLQHVFRVVKPVQRLGTIALVDDVITTGATTAACVHALRRAGAQRILVMAICRTPE